MRSPVMYNTRFMVRHWSWHVAGSVRHNVFKNRTTFMEAIAATIQWATLSGTRLPQVRAFLEETLKSRTSRQTPPDTSHR